MSGTVRARDGARLPFSTVTLTNLDTGAALRGAAGDLGTFVFADVPPGRYEVRVEAPGFRAAVLTLVLDGTTGDDVVLDPLLEVEAVSEAVTVMGTARRDTLEAAAIRELAATAVGEALAGQEGVWQLRKGSTVNDVVLRGRRADGLRAAARQASHAAHEQLHAACREALHYTWARAHITDERSRSLLNRTGRVAKMPSPSDPESGPHPLGRRECPNCRAVNEPEVLATQTSTQTAWVRCPACRHVWSERLPVD